MEYFFPETANRVKHDFVTKWYLKDLIITDINIVKYYVWHRNRYSFIQEYIYIYSTWIMFSLPMQYTCESNFNASIKVARYCTFGTISF